MKQLCPVNLNSIRHNETWVKIVFFRLYNILLFFFYCFSVRVINIIKPSLKGEFTNLHQGSSRFHIVHWHAISLFKSTYQLEDIYDFLLLSRLTCQLLFLPTCVSTSPDTLPSLTSWRWKLHFLFPSNIHELYRLCFLFSLTTHHHKLYVYLPIGHLHTHTHTHTHTHNSL